MADEEVEVPAGESAGAVSNMKYKAHLFGRMVRLKAEIAILQHQTNKKKKVMGVAIFDAMQNGDHKGAEVSEG
jgi:hypothetical protein